MKTFVSNACTEVHLGTPFSILNHFPPPQVFGVCHIFASFNDTFVHVTDISGMPTVQPPSTSQPQKNNPRSKSYHDKRAYKLFFLPPPMHWVVHLYQKYTVYGFCLYFKVNFFLFVIFTNYVRIFFSGGGGSLTPTKRKTPTFHTHTPQEERPTCV